MRIGLLSSWLSRLNGGVFEAVAAHAELLRHAGHEPVLIGLEDEHTAEDRARFGAAEVIACAVRGPRAIGYAPTLVPRLIAADLDLLHLHGIWMYPSHAGARWAARTGRPYLVSPHGMLDPWIIGRGRAKKAVARWGYERRSWASARAFHALTVREAADIAAATGRGDASLVIPNAVPIPPVTEPGRTRAPRLLYIGRIHPKKNVEGLIDGWRQSRDVLAPLGARLDIAGWGDAADVAALEAKLAAGADRDIAFLGPVYGARKAALLADARFVVLPSHSEGLPVAMLEAWAAGTPTMMSPACNLPEGFAAGAALDCGTEPARIAQALRDGFSAGDAAWQGMSGAARMLAAERFAPDVVAARWRDAYAGLLTGSAS